MGVSVGMKDTGWVRVKVGVKVVVSVEVSVGIKVTGWVGVIVGVTVSVSVGV